MKVKKKFITAKYEVHSGKIKKNAVVIAMVSDLHNVSLGEKNSALLQRIKEETPDMIVVAGDLVLGKPGAELETAYDFLAGAVQIAPVFYAPGNHEQRMKLFPDVYGPDYLHYEEKVRRLGVTILENTSEKLNIKGEEVCISGLVIPYGCYHKKKRENLESRELTGLLGQADDERFQLLLAHNPRFSKLYAKWGADVTFCGHYHGGMVRFPLLGGVISPDFRLFPAYSHGKYVWDGKYVIVGAGLGEHTIPLRLGNPRELVVVSCLPL